VSYYKNILKSKLKHCSLLILTAVFFSSCSSQNDKTPYALKDLSKREADLKYKTDFNSLLALQYLQYSKSLLKQNDQRDARYFANKGLRAINSNVSPESPKDWQLDPQTTTEINFTQARLNFLLSNYLKWLPRQLSRLVLFNDCWLCQEANKGAMSVDPDKNCKTKFYGLLEDLEKYIGNMDYQTLESSAKQIEVSELEFTKFEIFFDLSSYKINNDAEQKLSKIIEYLKTLDGDYKILLVGSTDKIGKEIYNKNLAMQRTKIINNYLTYNGVPAELIESRSLGSSYPAIITSNNGEQQLNRRVIIYILKNSQAQMLEIPLPLIENYVYKKQISRIKQGNQF
jgi:outer membrane protein OmpA-like peptidoglycan-associated protein